MNRLNDSNNSNNAKNIKHLQERPRKKWSEKSSYDKNKDNRCGQCGTPNWSRQHISPARSVECRNCKKKGHYEKMCRLPKRVQYLDKVSSSAEEDNWDYNKMQSVNNNKKGDYFHTTLSVNNTPIKLKIDSGSPVTLIPQRRFNRITEIEKYKTKYKKVNNNKIDFCSQTTATVNSNNTTLQLPLLTTKPNFTRLVGLDWMIRLGIALNTTIDDIKIHNIEMDDTEK